MLLQLAWYVGPSPCKPDLLKRNRILRQFLADDVGKSKPAIVLKSIIKTRLADEMRWERALVDRHPHAGTLFLLLANLDSKNIETFLSRRHIGDGHGNVLRRHYTSTYDLKLVAQTIDRYYLLLLYRKTNILCTQPHASMLLHVAVSYYSLHTWHTCVD